MYKLLACIVVSVLMGCQCGVHASVNDSKDDSRYRTFVMVLSGSTREYQCETMRYTNCGVSLYDCVNGITVYCATNIEVR